MKRAIIGGFLALLGTIWGLAVVIMAQNNPVSSWPTAQGRLLTSILQNGLALPAAIAVILLILGLVIMGREYFKKDT